MARQEEKTVNGQTFKLQSVSPTWYFQLNADCNIAGGGGKRDLVTYMDTLFKNVIISPAEVKTEGMAYFDAREDIETPELLVGVIEKFLRPGKKPSSSTTTGAEE